MKTTAPGSGSDIIRITPEQRISRRQVDKFAERRAELGVAALRTLGELGYARTSLREIAQHSGFSHGVLHYYFRDKFELISYCVRQYKAQCATRYDEIVARSTTAEELLDGFTTTLVATMRDDAPMHRLWYDLRAQAMFGESFRDDVVAIDASLESMIWRVVTRYCQLSGRTIMTSSPLTFALVDGVFQQALLRELRGDERAARDLVAGVVNVLDRLLD